MNVITGRVHTMTCLMGAPTCCTIVMDIYQ